METIIVMIVIFASPYGEPRADITEFTQSASSRYTPMEMCKRAADDINGRKVGNYPHAYCIRKGKLDQ